MTIHAELLQIAQNINDHIALPKLKHIHLPTFGLEQPSKKANFLAVELMDGSVGLSYALFEPIYEGQFKISQDLEQNQLDLMDIIKNLENSDPLLKTIAMATFNAVSQYFFRLVHFPFDFTTDPFGLLQLSVKDTLGMVGFFRPLIPLIEKFKIRCIIIEKKENLVQKKENWEVTLDPNCLEQCNKVFCTSSTIANDSIDDILSHCHHAQKVSIVGPTASFIPDPLFKRGVDVVGGTCIVDSTTFLSNLARNIPWGDTGQKYCIEKRNYLGYHALLQKIKK